MSMRYGIIRKYVQAAVLLGFAGAAFLGLPISNCSIKIGEFRVVYPTGFLETILLNHRINVDLVPGMILIVVLLVLFGRFYCSWICSASSANQLANPLLQKVISEKRFSRMERTWKSLRKKVSTRLNLGYGDAIALFIGIIAGIVIFDFPLLTIFNPIGLVSRSVIEFAVHHRLRFDLLLLTVPLLISLCFKNGWKTCCPEGLLLGFVARFNRTLIPVVNSEACNDCMKCQKACPVGIPAVRATLETSICQKCLQCIDVCSKQAVSLSPCGQKGEYRQGTQRAEPQLQARKSAPISSNVSSNDMGKKGATIIPLKRNQGQDNQEQEQLNGCANNKVA